MKTYTIERIIREVNMELFPEFEEKLRRHLEKHDKEWLIDQIIRMTLDKHSLQELDRKVHQQLKADERAKRTARLKRMKLDEPALDKFIRQYEPYDRERLELEGYLKDAPLKGLEIVPKECRTQKGVTTAYPSQRYPLCSTLRG